MREWQEECFDDLSRSHHWIVNAPTASGKSFVISAMLAASSAESLNARGGVGSGPDFGLGETNPSEAGIRHDLVHEGGVLVDSRIDFGRF